MNVRNAPLSSHTDSEMYHHNQIIEQHQAITRINVDQVSQHHMASPRGNDWMTSSIFFSCGMLHYIVIGYWYIMMSLTDI